MNEEEREATWGGNCLYHQGWFLCIGDIWTKTQKKKWNSPHFQEGAECVKKGKTFKCLRYCKICCNMNAINMLENLVKMEVSRCCIRQALGFKLLMVQMYTQTSICWHLTLNGTFWEALNLGRSVGHEGSTLITTLLLVWTGFVWVVAFLYSMKHMTRKPPPHRSTLFSNVPTFRTGENNPLCFIHYSICAISLCRYNMD